MTVEHEEPCFIDDDGPSSDLPPMPTLTNTRELFGLREGETLAEAIARQQTVEGRTDRPS